LQNSGSCVSGLKSLEIDLFGSGEWGSAIGDGRVKGFVNWVLGFSGVLFWSVSAGLAVQNIMFRKFWAQGFRSSGSVN
jgi:hypothetical protein